MITQASPKNARFESQKQENVDSPKSINLVSKNQIKQLELFPNKNFSIDNTVNSGGINEIMANNKELTSALLEMKRDND